METLIGGAYSGCPFKSLPTGYMLWAVENDKFKKQWPEIHRELTRRLGFYNMGLNAEPKWDDGCEHESWYQNWELKVQLQYVSMITTDSMKKKYKNIMSHLAVVLKKLDLLFPEQTQTSTFEDLFNDDELGPGETVDDITFEQANEFLNKKLDIELEQPFDLPDSADILYARLVAGRKQQPKLEDVLHKPKQVTVDDLLHIIRSRNINNGHDLAYQSLLNELETVTKMVGEQEQHFDLWELRDIAWHIQVVRSRLYWILRQREDDLS
jgi:hypothetical protein